MQHSYSLTEQSTILKISTVKSHRSNQHENTVWLHSSGQHIVKMISSKESKYLSSFLIVSSLKSENKNLKLNILNNTILSFLENKSIRLPNLPPHILTY